MLTYPVMSAGKYTTSRLRELISHRACPSAFPAVKKALEKLHAGSALCTVCCTDNPSARASYPNRLWIVR